MNGFSPVRGWPQFTISIGSPPSATNVHSNPGLLKDSAVVLPVKVNSISFEVVESPFVIVTPFPSTAVSEVSTSIGSSIVQVKVTVFPNVGDSSPPRVTKALTVKYRYQVVN